MLWTPYRILGRRLQVSARMIPRRRATRARARTTSRGAATARATLRANRFACPDTSPQNETTSVKPRSPSATVVARNRQRSRARGSSVGRAPRAGRRAIGPISPPRWQQAFEQELAEDLSPRRAQRDSERHFFFTFPSSAQAASWRRSRKRRGPRSPRSRVLPREITARQDLDNRLGLCAGICTWSCQSSFASGYSASRRALVPSAAWASASVTPGAMRPRTFSQPPWRLSRSSSSRMNLPMPREGHPQIGIEAEHLGS